MATYTEEMGEQIALLYNAIIKDDGSLAAYILLANDWDPRFPIYYGGTTPHITEANYSPWESALRFRRFNVVQAFLQVEETVLQRDWTTALLRKRCQSSNDCPTGWTLLHLACLYCYLPVVKLLLEKGALPTYQPQNIPYLIHLIPLGPRQDITYLKLLLEYGVVPGVQENRLLMRLLSFNDLKGLELVLDYYPNLINVRGESGSTPLHLAAARADKQPQLLRLVLQKSANVHDTTPDGNTVVHLIARHVKLNTQLVEWLVQAGAAIDMTNPLGETALHVVSQTMRKRPANTHQVEPFVRALAAHIDLEAVDINGKTPLHTAVQHVNLPVVRALLVLGANPGARDRGGWTPWHYACRSAQPKLVDEGLAILRALAAHGANPLVCTPEAQRSGLHEFILHVSQYRDVWFGLPIMHEILDQSSNGIIEQTDCDSLTALHYAALVGSEQIVTTLLERGFLVNARDAQGRTPLHLISGIHNDLSRTMGSLSRVIEALYHRAKWTVPDDPGKRDNVLTVERHANNDSKVALTGFRTTNAGVVEALIVASDADACAVDDHGCLPFFVACVNDARLDLIFTMVQNAALQGLFG